MKLARVHFLPFVAVSLVACSDPPSAPPEAAAYINVEAQPSATCQASHGLLTMPQDIRVYEYLNCDLGTNPDCEPDAIVAVDGDSETNIGCGILPQGSTFSVNGTVSYQGSDVSVSGVLGPNGGTAKMTHFFQSNGKGLSGDCTITILPNKGSIAGGRIWAHFKCDKFTDPRSPDGYDCAAEGAFLFQRCDGG